MQKQTEADKFVYELRSVSCRLNDFYFEYELGNEQAIFRDHVQMMQKVDANRSASSHDVQSLHLSAVNRLELVPNEVNHAEHCVDETDKLQNSRKG